MLSTARGFTCRYLKGKRVPFVGGVQWLRRWATTFVVQRNLRFVVNPAMRDEDAAGMWSSVTAGMFRHRQGSGSKALFFTASLLPASAKLMQRSGGDNGYANDDHPQRERPPILTHLAANMWLVRRSGVRVKASRLIEMEKPRVLLDAVANQNRRDISTPCPARSRLDLYGSSTPSAGSQGTGRSFS